MKLAKIFFIMSLLVSFASCSTGAVSTLKTDTNAETEITVVKEKAFSLYSEGKYDEAVPLAKKAIQMAEQHYGPEHEKTAFIIGFLGFIYKSQGDFAAAEPFYQRSLSIKEKVLGEEHPDTVITLNGLAALYLSQKNYAAARPLLQRTLRISEKTLGKEHPDTKQVREILLKLEK